MKNIFKRKVNEYAITSILRQHLKSISPKMTIHFTVTYTGIVKLYTNRPGILIGKHGTNIKMLTEKIKKECNAKDVKVYEMKHIISNEGIY